MLTTNQKHTGHREFAVAGVKLGRRFLTDSRRRAAAAVPANSAGTMKSMNLRAVNVIRVHDRRRRRIDTAIDPLELLGGKLYCLIRLFSRLGIGLGRVLSYA
jgi:hypothetical protein